MRRHVERELGPIDILVANAGGNTAQPGPVEETSEQDWRAALDGNLTATFLTVKSILPGMKERRAGTIITMSSAAARRPHPASPVAYAAAKAGIEIFPGPRRASWPVWHSGKLHSAGNDPHRAQQRPHPAGTAGGALPVASDPPAGHAGRCGARRALSRVGRRVVGRRHHFRRGRRRGDGVKLHSRAARRQIAASSFAAQLPRSPKASPIQAPP